MAKSIKKNKAQVYCEVNSYLRYIVEEIKSKINCDVILIVRDPKKVIRSIMSRKRAYTKIDPFNEENISPKFDTIHFTHWEEYTRFEKVCWYWVDANQIVLSVADSVLRFESLISDYSYLTDNIINNYGFDISFEHWLAAVKKPENHSTIFNFPPYEQWNSKEQYFFQNMCKVISQKLSYS